MDNKPNVFEFQIKVILLTIIELKDELVSIIPLESRIEQ